MIDRRTLFATAAAAAAAAAIPGAPAMAKAPLVGKQAPGFFRFKLGDAEVTAINDGFFVRPVAGFVRNAMDDDVKEAVEEAHLPMAGSGVFIPFTTLVINTGDRLTLIDSGNGDSGAPTSGHWMTNFRAAGFDPKDVDSIVISHFHGDHINGLRLKDGTAVFANAEVLVPATEWAFWMDDARMSAAPDAAKPNFQNVRRVFGPIAKDVKRFEAGKEVVPGINAIAAPGHTPGHTAFMIQHGSGKLLSLSDTTNNPYLFARNPEWQAVFDMNGDEAVTTRRKLLDMAASERARIHLYHAPFPATGFIEKDDDGYDFTLATWTSAL